MGLRQKSWRLARRRSEACTLLIAPAQRREGTCGLSHSTQEVSDIASEPGEARRPTQEDSEYLEEAERRIARRSRNVGHLFTFLRLQP